MDRRPGQKDAGFSVLTPRERDVMAYVALGKPNKIIAAELGVSQRTVEAHRARIFQKMRVRNAVELARRLLAPESSRFS
ncbi:MAG: LuxR family transcriptional regulator [Burkholderiaceae bacterium]